MEEKLENSSRRTNKPLMEKRRRARINTCLGELKSLVLLAMHKDNSQFSKLEKADILEMAVKYLRHVQTASMATHAMDSVAMTKYRLGYGECAREVMTCLTHNQTIGPELRHRVSDHLTQCLYQVQAMERSSTMLSNYPTSTISHLSHNSHGCVSQFHETNQNFLPSPAHLGSPISPRSYSRLSPKQPTLEFTREHRKDAFSESDTTIAKSNMFINNRLLGEDDVKLIQSPHCKTTPTLVKKYGLQISKQTIDKNELSISSVKNTTEGYSFLSDASLSTSACCDVKQSAKDGSSLSSLNTPQFHCQKTPYGKRRRQNNPCSDIVTENICYTKQRRLFGSFAENDINSKNKLDDVATGGSRTLLKGSPERNIQQGSSELSSNGQNEQRHLSMLVPREDKSDDESVWRPW